MTSSALQIRTWRGPAVLSYGFRPLFLVAGVQAVLAMVLWLLLITGRIALQTGFDPVAWHAHEFLFGYLSAVAAGFLLTAVPNWTGRLPIVGWPLAWLAGLWLLGRLAVTFGAALPPAVVAAADLAFGVVFAAAIGREIVAGHNWRNLPVLGLLAVLVLANLAFHIEAAHSLPAASGFGARTAVAVAVLMIALIGGRIVPSFTRNWLARRGPGRLPAPPDRFDQLALTLAALALLAWIALPEHGVAGLLCLVAGTAHIGRLARWAGWRTGSEPLVWVLHAGYGFGPLGFLLVGASALAPDIWPRTGAQHAWMAGAVGVMTLAVMTRATRGHTGQQLAVDRATTAIYLLAILAALLRVAAGFAPGAVWPLHGAAAAWIAAFGLFSAAYAPLLLRRKPGST